MKKLKLGFVAIALISGVSAFATKSTANAEATCSTTSGSIDGECDFGPNYCCTTASVSNVSQHQGAEQVSISPLTDVFRD